MASADEDEEHEQAACDVEDVGGNPQVGEVVERERDHLRDPRDAHHEEQDEYGDEPELHHIKNNEYLRVNKSTFFLRGNAGRSVHRTSCIRLLTMPRRRRDWPVEGRSSVRTDRQSMNSELIKHSKRTEY